MGRGTSTKTPIVSLVMFEKDEDLLWVSECEEDNAVFFFFVFFQNFKRFQNALKSREKWHIIRIDR